MPPIEVQVEYTAAQNQVLFECEKRFRVVTKGRRLGLTRGTSQAFVEWMLEKQRAMMWGDTIHPNIERYVDRYFKPVLKQLPSRLWDWKKQQKLLEVGNSYCDFRSADNPENWEGFGYDFIFLNEAGIILENAYLYENAVRPMLLDFPTSIAIIGGTPKGKNLFHDLYQQCFREDLDNWQAFKFSTYDNPFLSKDEIDELIAELPEATIRQEIFGDFMDTTENQFIDGTAVQEAMARTYVARDIEYAPKIIGVDVARFGDDKGAIAKRQGVFAYPIKSYEKMDLIHFGGLVAQEIKDFQPDAVFIDETGIGAGLVDYLRDLGFDVIGINFGSSAINSNRWANKRAEMWGELRDWIYGGGSLPSDNRGLYRELIALTYSFDTKNRIKLEKKEDMKKRGLASPDQSDALALTFAAPVVKASAHSGVTQTCQTDYELF